MESRKEKLKKYIKQLIDKTETAVYEKQTKSYLLNVDITDGVTITDGLCEELLTSTHTLLQALYGHSSSKPLQFEARFNDFTENPNEWCKYDHYSVLVICNGKLKAMLNDIEYGLIDNLESRISAEIFNDLLLLASQALEDGYTEVAAIISSVALEDTLKKVSSMHGGITENQTMAVVANYLKSQQVLRGSTGKQIDKYIDLRNKALHADWGKIQSPEVAGLIGFTEQLIRVHLSSS